ncbi:MAG: recombinase family protein [Lawsonibacter sp.]
MDTPRVALYLRLSRDDERAGESMSIENQRSYLTQYVKSRDWAVEQEYADDGCSGLTFDRPQFLRMLNDIEARRIDTVVTKDLSRLGRDQIYTAYYYQIYFPQRGVRYIAVSEGFDTAGSGGVGALFPFLTAANDFYTADVSRKVRSALTARKKEGKFIGARAPLGYQKDPEQRGHLVINEETAPVIRHIFGRYLELGSVTGLAKELTEQGFPTPSQYRGDETGREPFPGSWSGTMVRRILSNPTYAGHLTQNRRVKVNYKLSKRRNLPEDQWITVPNTHEPIVEQALFDQVRVLLEVHSYRREFRERSHLLTGLAYCADCGSPMTYVRESPNRIYMVCQGYRKGGRLKLCTPHRVREDRVIACIQGQLERLAQCVDWVWLSKAIGAEKEAEPRRCRQMQTARKLEQQKGLMAGLYRDRASGILTEAEFLDLFQRARNRRDELEGQLCQMAVTDGPEGGEPDEEQLKRMLSGQDPDRGMLTALIQQVRIHQDKTVELVFRFSPPKEAHCANDQTG